MSFEMPKRPLLADEQRDVQSEFESDLDVAQLFDAIAAQCGERLAEEVAQGLVWSWMLESMEERLLDAETGALPRFMLQLERSTQWYNHQLG